MTSESKKLPLMTLTAMVVGSMVGSGIFSLPRTFGNATGPFGALIAWAIAVANATIALILVFGVNRGESCRGRKAKAAGRTTR